MLCSRCGTKIDTAAFDTLARSAAAGITALGKKLSKSTSLRTKGG
jgi:hypothetical protein